MAQIIKFARRTPVTGDISRFEADAARLQARYAQSRREWREQFPLVVINGDPGIRSSHADAPADVGPDLSADVPDV